MSIGQKHLKAQGFENLNCGNPVDPGSGYHRHPGSTGFLSPFLRVCFVGDSRYIN
jgi:hypothetical protein